MNSVCNIMALLIRSGSWNGRTKSTRLRPSRMARASLCKDCSTVPGKEKCSATAYDAAGTPVRISRRPSPVKRRPAARP